MPTALDYVQVQVAFSADPNTASPSWVEMTDRARMDEGITIVRGRQDYFDDVAAGQVTLTLDNTDGYLTPGNVASPYYPNVKPQNRVRVTYRDPAVDGNLLSAENASFESGSVGGWYPGNGATLSNSTTQAWTGTRSLRVVWSTSLQDAKLDVTGLVAGRTYTVSAYVYVGGVSGGSVGLGVLGIGTSATRSSWNNTWGRLTYTFTATASTHTIQVGVIASTSRTDYIDGVQVDEGGVRTFTTAAAPIVNRFDGYVEGWPVVWPTGGKSLSTVTVTAHDLQARLARTRTLGSVIHETLRLDAPTLHFPLGESSGSSTVGDIRGTGYTLAVTQIGSGGTLEFGAGTGPGTDGAGAPLFTPASETSGKYLYGRFPSWQAYLSSRFTAEIVVNAPTVIPWAMSALRLEDDYFARVNVYVQTTGNVVAQYVDPWGAGAATVVSAGTINDARTHSIMVKVDASSGTTMVVTLYIDGNTEGSASIVYSGGYVPNLRKVYVGGHTDGALWSGTLSHVALFDGASLSLGTAIVHHNAVSTGFAGELTGARMSRVLSWAGVTSSSFLDIAAGSATVAHVECSGMSPWEYLALVNTTEAGLLWVSTDGKVTFRDRSYAYDTAQAVTVTVTGDDVGPDLTPSVDIVYVVNEVRVTRTTGAVFRATDAASITAYGTLGGDVETATDSDRDAFDRANWLLAIQSTPTVRIPTLTLDALTTSAARSLTISPANRISLSTLPSQSPVTTADLRPVGYTEAISAGGWSVVCSTAPFLLVSPLILDDNTYGLLDSNNRIVY